MLTPVCFDPRAAVNISARTALHEHLRINLDHRDRAGGPLMGSKTETARKNREGGRWDLKKERAQQLERFETCFLTDLGDPNEG